MSIPTVAAAQGNSRVFVATVRDPGATVVFPTARSLALGGLETASGSADEAAISPSTLVFGTGTDFVLTVGTAGYSTTAPAATVGSNLFSQEQSVWVNTPRSTKPGVFGALAARRSRWAVGGFVEATRRVDYRFDSGDGVLSVISSPGGVVFSRSHGTSAGAVSRSETTFGGAVAAGRADRRAAIGAAVYLTKLHYDAAATLLQTTDSTITLPPDFRRVTTTTIASYLREANSDGVRPGWIVSGSVKPTTWATLSARWRNEPRFRTTLREVVESSTPGVAGTQVDDAHALQLPDSWAVSAVFASTRTLLGVGIDRVMYADFFQPVTRDPWCEEFCAGWGLDNDHAADALTLHIGVEQRAHVGAAVVKARAGLRAGEPYTVASSAFPPRQDVRGWSVGAGLERGRLAVDVGYGAGHGRRQLLADLRVSLPRATR